VGNWQLAVQKFKEYIIIYEPMLLTPHVLVGITVGTAISNPNIAVPLSFGMHFLGDLVPHWDFYSGTKLAERRTGWRPIAVMGDLILGVAIGLTLTLYALWVLGDARIAANIFLCGIAAVLPDAVEAPHIFMDKDPGIIAPIAKLQSKLQFQAPLPWGVLTQIAIMIVCSVLISHSLGL
jgi:hypothetical protein